jgi:tetratricopeptide (TPR) repeat protein
LGEIYFKCDRLESAIMYLNQAIELFPSSGEAHYFRGQAYEALGMLSQAQADVDRAGALGHAPGAIESFFRAQ